MAQTHVPPGRPSAERARVGTRVAARLEADPRFTRLPSEAVAAWRSPGFLSSNQCAMLCAMIEAKRRPSTLLSDTGTSVNRTSDSCDMDRYSPAVRPIDEMIADALGIAPEYGETMQGQRYAVGQHFRTHHDYFHEGESYWPKMQQTGGQRTWTAMIYLNDVEEGGATWFPKGGMRVNPRPGMLFAWNNMGADGSPNTATLHEGMPVMDGVKYIVTKWFREKPWVALVADA